MSSLLRFTFATLASALVFLFLQHLAPTGHDLWVGPAMVAGGVFGAIYWREEA